METEAAMTDHLVSTYAGLCRELEIGFRIAPTQAAAPTVARRVAALLESTPQVTVRLAELESSGTRVHITLAVCLGTIDQIKAAEARSRAAVEFLCAASDAFAAHDPAFVTLPAHVGALERLFASVTPESIVGSMAAERLISVG
jgi:hypothetical protein